MAFSEQGTYRIGAVSLGCSKNLVDTEEMLGLLTAAGHQIVADPAEADVIVINTCGFIEKARQESIDSILEYAQYKKTGSCRKLVVTGCLSQRYREELIKELPEVDIFLGVREYAKLPGLLAGRECLAAPAPRLLTTPGYTAYLRIADGCVNKCTYCAIPLIRGPMKSLPMDAILAEALRLVDCGVKEITLIAQDTSAYGHDLYGKPLLLPLMEQIAAINGLHWLRVLYTYPDTVTPELVQGMLAKEKICNYLDMPLQHINDEMLARMNRRGSRAHIEEVLRYIRQHAPSMILRTTMMVGFPGESEEQFQELLEFITEYPFDRLGAFAFSPEEGTAAAQMPKQVPEEIRQERLHRLMTLQREISRKQNEKRVGSVLHILIESVKNGLSYGRSYGEAPEVDGLICIPAAPSHRAGEFIKARITSALDYELMGEEIP